MKIKRTHLKETTDWPSLSISDSNNSNESRSVESQYILNLNVLERVIHIGE